MLTTHRNPKNKDETGFTLLELMIVIVIIGILAAIAIPIFANQQHAATEATIKSDLKNAGLAIQTEATKTAGRYNPDALPTSYSSTGGNVIEIKPISSSTNLVEGSAGSPLTTQYSYHNGSAATIVRTASEGTSTYNTGAYGGPYWAVTNKDASYFPAGTQITVSLKLTLSKTGCFSNYVEQWAPDNTYMGNAGTRQTCLTANIPQTVTFTATTTGEARRITFVNYKAHAAGDVLTWEEPTIVAGDTIDSSNITSTADQKYCVQGYSQANPTKIWSLPSTTGKIREGKC